MFCFIFLLGHNVLGTELMAGLCSVSFFNLQYPLFFKDNSVAAYIFFLVFPSLLSFLLSFIRLLVLKSSSYAGTILSADTRVTVFPAREKLELFPYSRTDSSPVCVYMTIVYFHMINVK
jgi:hypothetical protein